MILPLRERCLCCLIPELLARCKAGSGRGSRGLIAPAAGIFVLALETLHTSFLSISPTEHGHE